MTYKLVTFCLLSLASQNLMAEATPTESTSSVATAKISTSVNDLKSEGEAKKFSLDLDLSSDSNLRSTSDPAYQANSSITLSPAYKFNSLISISGKAGLDQKLYADQKTELANTSIKLSFSPFNLDESRAATLFLSGVLPTNETDRLQNSFQGAAGAGADFTQKYFTLGIRENGQAKLTLSALKNFHQFESSSEFVPNISYRIRETADMSQDITKKLSVEVIGYYQTGFTYNNDLKTFFHLEENLQYAATKQIAFYIGHANEANALQNNGIDSNISLYDAYTSTYKAGTTISF